MNLGENMATNDEKKYPITELEISLLQFDGKNPRLPENIRNEKQSNLLKLIFYTTRIKVLQKR